jgi:tRNA(Ile)-lysidine synthase
MPKGLSPPPFASSAVQWLLDFTGPKPDVVVAYSGGVDSTVLAHMLVKQRRRLGELRLAHVDHGLQSASSDWSEKCRLQAKAWRVPFIALRASVAKRRGESPEALARDARYASLASVLKPGEFLLTAQHRDDQVETVLLQLLRGAGVPGLAAMPRHAPFARGTLVRPLIDLTRRDIEQYANHHGLAWIDDPTNAQDRFDRNYLRLHVIPKLRERWLGVPSAIHRTARHMADAAQLLDAQAGKDLFTAMDGDGLNVSALRRLPRARRTNALRLFIARSGIEVPPTTRMNEISGALLAARQDAQPEVRWQGAAILRRSGRLILKVHENESPSADLALKSWPWEKQRKCVVSVRGDQMELIDDVDGPVDLDKLPALLHPRPRIGGEKLRPGARARTQSLKKLMQSARLPVEIRARIPLLFAGEGPKGHLIAAGDRWIDASVAATVKSRRRARLVWRRGK